uniref:Uncharacterized protein n=1 Tax=Rhizophora mucronata TaxID=61149 RepID=A0A2P2QUC2_RHIMU
MKLAGNLAKIRLSLLRVSLMTFQSQNHCINLDL